MAFHIPDIDETQAPLLDHLIELRTRLLRAFLAFAVAFGVCFYFSSDIFSFLVRPLTEAFPAGQGKLIYTKLYEAFFVEVKVALFAAFFVSFPVIANQIWAFVAPGLYAKEKKAFLPFLIATPVLFTMGAALAGGTGDYLALVMQFILAFGISFLMPVLLMLLNRAGIVSRVQVASARRYAIVGIFIIAAVATPPDVISQLLLAVPLIALFEGTLVVMWFTERRDAQVKAAEEKAAAEVAAAEAAVE
ncbi:MAG: twin-arginine translocase subunit TatC [Novosphingobium sp.]